MSLKTFSTERSTHCLGYTDETKTTDIYQIPDNISIIVVVFVDKSFKVHVCSLSSQISGIVMVHMYIFIFHSLQHQHLSRGTWTYPALWESCIQSYRVFLHQKCWIPTNLFLVSLELIQVATNSVCHTFIGFQRYTKIPINTDPMPVQ